MIPFGSSGYLEEENMGAPIPSMQKITKATDTIYECKHCGSAVYSRDKCPSCGSSEVIVVNWRGRNKGA